MKRYTVVYAMSSGHEYTEIIDKESIEMINNHVENMMINPYFFLKHSDGMARLTTAHVSDVDIFEGTDVH